MSVERAIVFLTQLAGAGVLVVAVLLCALTTLGAVVATRKKLKVESEVEDRVQSDLYRLDRWLAEDPAVCLVLRWLDDNLNRRGLGGGPRGTPESVTDLRDKFRRLRDKDRFAPPAPLPGLRFYQVARVPRVPGDGQIVRWIVQAADSDRAKALIARRLPSDSSGFVLVALEYFPDAGEGVAFEEPVSD